MSARQFLLDEDRGVSPVIGVILMVAITVILAAVIATFVMNMGPPETTAPNAQFSWDNGSYNGGSGDVYWIKATHDGGEAVELDNVKLVVNDGDETTFISFNNGPPSELTSTDALNATSDQNSDDVEENSNNFGDHPESAELIWMNPENDQTQILAEWEA